MKISIIGVGRLGGALALGLANHNYKIENLVSRGAENARKVSQRIAPQEPRLLKASEFSEIDSDIVFISTQDAEIETVAESLARELKNKPFVFHTSGALSSDVLGKLKKIGCPVGSIHPLVSISDSVLGAGKFRNAFFCVEGEARAVETAKKIIESLGGKSFSIETRFKTLYHSAAVTACGHLVALIDVAVEMLEKCDLPEAESRQILLPLIKSTVENLETQTTERALTGTFARGDDETLQRQIETLRRSVSPEALEVFLQLGSRSLHLARRQKSVEARKLDAMSETLQLAKKNIK
ncbi:MAG: DUF2520 domain-containing protein [Acidobacteria bacterium]|nr:DUF2520 domain-containing protein [Acidobacteriota bacterium]